MNGDVDYKFEKSSITFRKLDLTNIWKEFCLKVAEDAA